MLILVKKLDSSFRFSGEFIGRIGKFTATPLYGECSDVKVSFGCRLIVSFEVSAMVVSECSCRVSAKFSGFEVSLLGKISSLKILGRVSKFRLCLGGFFLKRSFVTLNDRRA